MRTKDEHSLVFRALVLTLGSCWFYLATEWLFFVTKPSLFSYLNWPQRIGVLLLSPLPLMAICLATLGLSVLLVALLERTGSIGKRARIIYVLVPGLVLAAAGLLLVDNFTYTMFRFGVSSLAGPVRIVHSLIFLTLLVLAWRVLFRQLDAAALLGLPERFWKGVVVAFALAALGTGVVKTLTEPGDGRDALSGLAEVTDDAVEAGKNVLIFSSDGIDAGHMSAYGYQRDTTPFVRSLAPEMLVFENHFTNAAKTTGSIVSMLSGKSPTTTRVIFRPDVLTGVDAYEHLPGVLRRSGYDTGDFSVRQYVDPLDLNMRGGFRYANGRDLANAGFPLPDWFRERFATTTQFIDESYLRLEARVLHLTFVETMSNAHSLVTRPELHLGTDRERIEDLKQFMASARKPFFAHVHLLGTHGATFHPGRPKWSAGQEQRTEWMVDFYDDAVLEFDSYVAEIVGFLRSEGLYEETLLILSSDHGFEWGIHRPIPLMIRFPGAEPAGVADFNSQRLDLAPTILDYLRIPIPAWMEGESVLSSDRDPREPIFVVDRMPSVTVDGWREVPSPQPPFYTLGVLGVIYCDQMYLLSLQTGEFIGGSIEEHTRPCAPSVAPPGHEVFSTLIRHLADAGYDVGSLTGP
jgi:arylsulfatase A-like enzyme